MATGTITKFRNMELLWTNSSPSLGMAATSIPLPTNDYDAYLIQLFYSYPKICEPLVLEVGYEALASVPITTGWDTGSFYGAFLRSFSMTSNTALSVGTGRMAYTNANDVRDTALVPYRIFGIRY